MNTVTNLAPRLPAHAALPTGCLNGAQLAAAAHITYRQVDFWTRAGYLRPTDGSPGSGYQRIYPPHELTVARLMAALVHAGLTAASAATHARDLATTGTTHIAGMPLHLPQDL